MSKDISPFSPGKPVSPEFFVGRTDQRKLLERALRQAQAGSPQYLFLTGERGIGKSSLAHVGRQLAEAEFDFIGAQAQLGGAESLGEVCRRLYQAMLSQLPEKYLYEKVVKLFGDYIDKVTLFGFGIEFKKDQATRDSLAEDFLSLLFQVGKIIKESGKKGIYLVADDLNGIAANSQFAHFLKSTVDQIAVGNMRNFPWVFSLVGIPERMDDLKNQQPSIDRIFQPIELTLMNKADAVKLFEQSFNSVEMTWDADALDYMATAAGGHPVMWHELGDAVFWENQDMHIDRDDVYRGLNIACENVGRKYLARPLYDEIRSQSYQKILEYIASLELNPPYIRRVDAKTALSGNDFKSFDNFIRKMRERGIIRNVPGEQGVYQFTNLLFHLYVIMRSQQQV